eukprot:4345318-Pleurochrysis_carterae.AAC.1
MQFRDASAEPESVAAGAELVRLPQVREVCDRERPDCVDPEQEHRHALHRRRASFLELLAAGAARLRRRCTSLRMLEGRGPHRQGPEGYQSCHHFAAASHHRSLPAQPWTNRSRRDVQSADRERPWRAAPTARLSVRRRQGPGLLHVGPAACGGSRQVGVQSEQGLPQPLPYLPLRNKSLSVGRVGVRRSLAFGSSDADTRTRLPAPFPSHHSSLYTPTAELPALSTWPTSPASEPQPCPPTWRATSSSTRLSPSTSPAHDSILPSLPPSPPFTPSLPSSSPQQPDTNGLPPTDEPMLEGESEAAATVTPPRQSVSPVPATPPPRVRLVSSSLGIYSSNTAKLVKDLSAAQQEAATHRKTINELRIKNKEVTHALARAQDAARLQGLRMAKTVDTARMASNLIVENDSLKAHESEANKRWRRGSRALEHSATRNESMAKERRDLGKAVELVDELQEETKELTEWAFSSTAENTDLKKQLRATESEVEAAKLEVADLRRDLLREQHTVRE